MMLLKYCIILVIFFKYGICGYGRNIFWELNGIIIGNQIFMYVEGLYLVISDLVVVENVIFVIEFGIQVNFFLFVGICVYGLLNVKGIFLYRIIF